MVVFGMIKFSVFALSFLKMEKFCICNRFCNRSCSELIGLVFFVLFFIYLVFLVFNGEIVFMWGWFGDF